MSPGRRWVSLIGALVVLAAVVLAALGGGSALADSGDVAVFGSIGSEQSFVVPLGVHSIGAILVGGKGADGTRYFGAPGGAGGMGAHVQARLEVTPGEVIYVEVGENGSNGGGSAFNGGGVRGAGSGTYEGGGIGGGGGGATDLRRCARAASNCSFATNTLNSRILVAAGGGGGGGATYGGGPIDGGAGGSAGGAADGSGAAGEDGHEVAGGGGGGGATTGSGGAGGIGRNSPEPLPSGSGGAYGFGGTGGESGNPGGGGGGGGGVFGGGGGGAGFSGGGAGGGSSYGPAGTEFSTDASGVPVAILYFSRPEATTQSTTAVGEAAATLHAGVDPMAQETSYRFEYGTSESYGRETPAQQAGSGTEAVSGSAALSGLEPGTTYHYRVVAENPVGVSFGADRTFTTAATPSPTPAPAPSPTPTPTPTPAPKGSRLALAVHVAPRHPRVGGRAVVRLRVSNAGPAAAAGIRVNLGLPRQLRFASGDAACGANGGTVTCAIPSLAAGEATQLSFRAAVRGPGRARIVSVAASELPGTEVVAARARVDLRLLPRARRR